MTRIARKSPDIAERLLVFPSKLGWMAVAMAGDAVRRLTFGHRSRRAAIIAIDPSGRATTFAITAAERNVIARLQSYAEGKPDALGDRGDILIDFGPMSEFRRRVLTCCRRIPYGRTVSYAKLAAQAGSPGAARAVGNCMAANPIPLLIPCHRVICADSRIGAYSALGGTAMKQRLLAMEQDQ